MTVARVRCTSCRTYVPREEVYFDSGVNRICSEDCLKALHERSRVRARAKAKAKARPKARKVSSLDPAVRRLVRARDGNVCRWCGKRGEQVHHVLYRSQGGPDEPSNLILLCMEHHGVVHGNKHHWQPTLLAVLWLGYVEGRWLTIPEVERYLMRYDLLERAS